MSMIRKSPRKIPFKEVNGEYRLSYGESQGFEEAILVEEDE